MKKKILLITSKWPDARHEIDGGGMTAINICETLKGTSLIDLLLPETYKDITIHDVNNVYHYRVNLDDWSIFNGPDRFRTRIKASISIKEIVERYVEYYDNIIILHVFHAFNICNSFPDNYLKKIILFPMLLSPSYVASQESVPIEYIELEKNTLNRVGFIITPSIYEKNLLMSEYHVIPSKIKVIPRFSNQLFFSDIPHKLPMNKLKLCCIGSVKKQKQNHLAVQLLSNILSRGADAELFLVGPVCDQKEYEEMLLEIESCKIHDKVFYHQALSQKELSSLMTGMDVNISVSACETFGRSIIEGLCNGLPAVVLSQIECFNSLIGKNNGVIYVSNIDKMADAVIEICRNKLLYEQLSREALSFGKKFSQDIIKPQLLESLLCDNN